MLHNPANLSLISKNKINILEKKIKKWRGRRKTNKCSIDVAIKNKTQNVQKNVIFPFYFNGTVLNRKQICNAEPLSGKKQTVVVKESDERRLGFHLARLAKTILILAKLEPTKSYVN